MSDKRDYAIDIAKRKVIEAAKAMHEGLKGNPAVEYAEREILDLDVAVEALLAAEGEA